MRPEEVERIKARWRELRPGADDVVIAEGVDYLDVPGVRFEPYRQVELSAGPWQWLEAVVVGLAIGVLLSVLLGVAYGVAPWQ